MEYELITEAIRANSFYELATLLGITALVAFIGHVLRQPVIVSFIVVGVIVGPSALDIVHSDDSIALLSQLGIAILLFLVGLKLDLSLVKALGKVALATGLGQVAFTSAIGFGICLLLGFDVVTALYIGVALTFSSTIIIVKMLSDKREVDSLHGRIAIGFLIVQDIVVVIAMVVLSALGIGDQVEQSLWQRLGSIFLSAILMLFITILFIKFIANSLVKKVAKSSELLLVFAVALAGVFASIGHILGFSKELGGLLAGVALASTPYREAIITRLASLRDFLLLFFFIALGSQLDLSILGDQLASSLVLSVFVLIGNPLIVIIIMGVMGYRARTGFLAGLTVAQISEFSLIFIAMGISIGHLQKEALGLVTLVGLITIALSVYMISYSHSLYDKLADILRVFQNAKASREDEGAMLDNQSSPDILVCGAGHYGTQIIEQLLLRQESVGIIDFNPDVYHKWLARNQTCFFGDITDVEFLSHLPLRQAQWFVVTLPRDAFGSRFESPRKQLVENLKRFGFKGRIALATEFDADIESAKQLGIDHVLTPYRDAAKQTARLLLD